MKYYGTKNNKDYGFYLENFENAIEISDEYWMELLNSQCEGKIIIPYENTVIAVFEKDYVFEDNTWKKLSKEDAALKEQKRLNAIRYNEIQDELNEIDKKKIRAFTEPSNKDDNTTWLEYYNSKAETLRTELAALQI